MPGVEGTATFRDTDHCFLFLKSFSLEIKSFIFGRFIDIKTTVFARYVEKTINYIED